MNALSFSSWPASGALHPPHFHVSSVHRYGIQSKFISNPSRDSPKTITVSTSKIAAATSEPPPRLSKPTSQTTPTTKTLLPPSKTRKRSVVESSLANEIFNAIDHVITNFVDSPLRPFVDPQHLLSNNFAPVDELPPTVCPVEGKLPPCLNGAYIRNGPNPQHVQHGPYHLFDGDGMLHSLLISQGRATFCSRYVKTYKYLTEQNAGSSLLPNFFSTGLNGLPAMAARSALFAARVICGQYDPNNGIGNANTSLAFLGNKLFALQDSDLPYEVCLTREGDIETIGRHHFDGKESSSKSKSWITSMTAHPKIDADTGEVFAFRYGITPPFLTFFRLDPNGSKQEPEVPIFSIKKPTFIHDFAITKKYAIFPDIQMGIKPMEIIMGRGGGLLGLDPQKVPRIGVMPRYAKDDSELRWFELPGVNIVHTMNAWDDEEEEDVIIMIAPNILSVEHMFERMELAHASIEKIRIDLKTGIISRLPLSTRSLELGVINKSFVGKKNRYGYAAAAATAMGSRIPKVSGVVKLDWSTLDDVHQDRIVASRMFGSGCYGGEPFFVARSKQEGAHEPEAEEDDGYLVTYVHDENSGESQFLVMNATSPNLDIVARVKLPRRVPYGIHGLFVSENDLFNTTTNETNYVDGRKCMLGFQVLEAIQPARYYALVPFLEGVQVVGMKPREEVAIQCLVEDEITRGPIRVPMSDLKHHGWIKGYED